MAKALPRLTEAMVRRACRKTQAQGIYELVRQGYLPEEIYVHANCIGSKTLPEIKGAARTYAAEHGLPVPASCNRIREYVRHRAAPEDPRTAFKRTVMRTGLALVLTQPMLEELCAVACGTKSDRALYFQQVGSVQPHNFIATRAALEKRGLITCEAEPKLTSIGECLVDLLKEAQVFVTPDSAFIAKEARRV